VLWHQQPVEATLEALRVSARGLASAEAKHRLAVHGPNVLREGKRRTALSLLAGQFTDFMILVLLVAAVISGLIGDVVDTVRSRRRRRRCPRPVSRSATGGTWRTRAPP
jgi:Ca2+-transporting ATPase